MDGRKLRGLPISIIVPTYNESQDIQRTLEALLTQRYHEKEIIVVDDSTDDTPAIVQAYEPQGVRLIRPPVRRGRCEARNIGIQAAGGEVVVLLNADVFPEPDFLNRIANHYRAGADYVLVESRVVNDNALFPRYIQALHESSYSGQDFIEWTEGFSCRREVALAVGLFPETPIPLCAGEDGYFGQALSKQYRKVIDRSIVVPHVMPETLSAFWAQQFGRGRGTPLVRYFLHRRPISRIAVRQALKTVWIAMAIGLIIPVFLASGQLVRFSRRGHLDLVSFWWAHTISLVAQLVGSWRGLLEVWRRDRAGRAS